jgi:hypothetical protein
MSLGLFLTVFDIPIANKEPVQPKAMIMDAINPNVSNAAIERRNTTRSSGIIARKSTGFNPNIKTLLSIPL